MTGSRSSCRTRGNRLSDENRNSIFGADLDGTGAKVSFELSELVSPASCRDCDFQSGT